jgi:exosortase A
MGVLTRNQADPHALAKLRDQARKVIPEFWRLPSILTLAAITVSIVMFRATILEMVSTWLNSRTFSHCLLVPPLSVYMVWQRRNHLASMSPMPNPLALVLIGAAGVVWLLGNIGEIRVIEEFAWVAILIALIWALLGTSIIRGFAFPLGFLFFSVPFGLSLISPLQDITAWIAVHALNLTGVPAVLEHRLLSVPSSTWTVAEACSGVRYLFSSVMVGVIFAKFVYRSRKRRLVFVLCSVLVPILANGLRAYAIVLLAYLSDNRIAIGVDHIVYGWLFFAVVQLAMFGVGLRWMEPAASAKTFNPGNTVGAKQSIASTVHLRGRCLAIASLAILILVLLPTASRRLWLRADAKAQSIAWPDPPVTVAPPWQIIKFYDRSWTPELHSVTRSFEQGYASGSDHVDLYWALYSEHGFELLNSYNRNGSPKAWAAIADSRQLEKIESQPVQVRRTLFVSGAVNRWMWTWYRVKDEYTSSAERVKYLQAKARLSGSCPTTIVFVLSMESAKEEAAAEATIREFLSHATFLNPHAANPSVQAESAIVQEFSH